MNDIDVYNNPVVFNEYEPGSVFKTITMALGDGFSDKQN